MNRLIWVLASVPVFTVAVIVRVADVPLGTVPMFQTPVAESYVPAPWVSAATKVTPGGERIGCRHGGSGRRSVVGHSHGVGHGVTGHRRGLVHALGLHELGRPGGRQDVGAGTRLRRVIGARVLDLGRADARRRAHLEAIDQGRALGARIDGGGHRQGLGGSDGDRPHGPDPARRVEGPRRCCRGDERDTPGQRLGRRHAGGVGRTGVADGHGVRQGVALVGRRGVNGLVLGEGGNAQFGVRDPAADRGAGHQGNRIAADAAPVHDQAEGL